MRNTVFAALLICFVVPCYGNSHKSKWEAMQSWNNYFRATNVQGCFLLYDLQKDQYWDYNRKRVNTGFLLASTYKIFNSLIALEAGAVRDENEVLKWDGVERVIPILLRYEHRYQKR